MKIKPLADRVLLRIDDAETKTASGLFIPQTAQEKTQQGLIIDIGSDQEVITVLPGDKVMFDKYAGTPVKIDGSDHLIIDMQDIIAVIEGE